MSTLKEKFIPLTLLDASDEERGNQCVNIAEEFAIGFAEWLPNNAYKESKCWRMYDKKDNEYNIKELLEIYKKEKEL